MVKHGAEVMGVSESWFASDVKSNNLSVPGYLYCFDINGRSGGVGISVNKYFD